MYAKHLVIEMYIFTSNSVGIQNLSITTNLMLIFMFQLVILVILLYATFMERNGLGSVRLLLMNSALTFGNYRIKSRNYHDKSRNMFTTFIVFVILY